MVFLHQQQLPSRKRPASSSSHPPTKSAKPKPTAATSSSSNDAVDKMIAILADAGCTLVNPAGPPCLPSDPHKLRRHLHRTFSSSQTATADFLSGLSSYLQNPSHLRRVLTGSTRSESLLRNLLLVPSIQVGVQDLLLEKLPEYFHDDSSSISLKDDVSRLIINHFRWLDFVVDADALAEKLMQVLSVCPLHLKKEIIGSLPEIVGDRNNAAVVQSLEKMLEEDKDVVVAVLDSFSNLGLDSELQEQVSHPDLNYKMGLVGTHKIVSCLGGASNDSGPSPSQPFFTGTTVGALLYTKGLVAFCDSRMEVLDPVTLETLEYADSAAKHFVISTKSELFYLSCGDKKKNETLLDSIKEDVQKAEEDGGEDEVVRIDSLAQMVSLRLNESLNERRRDNPEDKTTVGGVFIGRDKNKRFGAHSLILNKLDIESVALLVGGTDRVLIKGQGISHKEAIEDSMRDRYPMLDAAFVEGQARRALFMTQITQCGTGGLSNVFTYPDEGEYGGSVETDPVELHLENLSSYPGQIFIMRVHVSELGNAELTECRHLAYIFLKTIAGWIQGRLVPSIFVNKQGYFYFRCSGKLVDQVYQELMGYASKESNEGSQFHKLKIPSRNGDTHILVEVGMCSQRLLQEINEQ